MFIKSKVRHSGFTLVELLVVIAILALLVSILLPSLASARNQAKAIKCAANLRSIGQGVSAHLSGNNGIYPPSYFYPRNKEGYVDLDALYQDPAKTYGYTHWSHFVYGGNGGASEAAFQCPNLEDGGAPRTFPGPNADDWELGWQVDDLSRNYQQAAASNWQPVDKQARRMAYTANAAIMPRNKFSKDIEGMGDAKRLAQLVSDSRIRRTSHTILATEFVNNYEALTALDQTDQGNFEAGFRKSKAHRPIMVWSHIGYDTDESNWEFQVPEKTPGFVYTPLEELTLPDAEKTYHLKTQDELENGGSVAEMIVTDPINCVGRHHPGGQDRWGGAANFLYIDGHVERKNVWDTMNNQEWGDEFYSLIGRSEIIDAKK